MSVTDTLTNLTALYSDPEPETTTSTEPVEIALSDIKPDPNQPRTEFNQELINTLAVQFIDLNIGQIEPITVRTVKGKKQYLIVHGETRYRAAQQAELESIRAIVISADSASFVRQLISNETRADLPLMDKARAYQSLIDKHRYTQEQVAAILGKSQQSISDHLHLLDMPALAMQAYEQGKATSVRVLVDLARLINAHEKPKAKREQVERFVSQSETITRASIAALSKMLSSTKKAPKAKPEIDGKPVSIKTIEQDIITFKIGKELKQYRLLPVDNAENAS